MESVWPSSDNLMKHTKKHKIKKIYIYFSIFQEGQKFRVWNISKWKFHVKYFIPITLIESHTVMVAMAQTGKRLYVYTYISIYTGKTSMTQIGRGQKNKQSYTKKVHVHARMQGPRHFFDLSKIRLGDDRVIEVPLYIIYA